MNSRRPKHPDKKNRDFWKIGHRGYPKVAPENTSASFEKAILAGADMIEFDVTSSSDGELFVFHDEKINRTSNGMGEFALASSVEIQKLDAGSWFSDEFQGEKIPTLEEVLQRFGSKIALNIEIKEEALKVQPDIGEKVLGALVHQGLLETAVVSSFQHEILKSIRKKNHEVFLAALYASSPSSSELKEADAWGADMVHLNAKGLEERDIKLASDLGFPVRVYTVNDASQARSLRDWGVDGVFTDDLSLFGEE